MHGIRAKYGENTNKAYLDEERQRDMLLTEWLSVGEKTETDTDKLSQNRLEDILEIANGNNKNVPNFVSDNILLGLQERIRRIKEGEPAILRNELDERKRHEEQGLNLETKNVKDLVIQVLEGKADITEIVEAISVYGSENLNDGKIISDVLSNYNSKNERGKLDVYGLLNYCGKDYFYNLIDSKKYELYNVHDDTYVHGAPTFYIKSITSCYVNSVVTLFFDEGFERGENFGYHLHRLKKGIDIMYTKLKVRDN